MELTLQLTLLPTDDHATALRATMERFNAAHAPGNVIWCCGYTTHADINAAQNIRKRARVMAPMVAGRRPQQLSLLVENASVVGRVFGGNASDKLRPAGRSM